jgi:cellulose synthase/poly-beta-1,6-N-acetylglucosamine synthase-like glycosyltransferase
MAAAAGLRPRQIRKRAGETPRVSVLIAAHNEADRIGARLSNVLAVQYPADRLEIVVISDGSRDGTERVLAEAAARHPEGRIRWAATPERAGKAAALNRAAAMAGGEILVFTDARQRFHPTAVRELVENFADLEVGAVSGELVLLDTLGNEHVTGLYWRFEKWLRKCEARFDSAIGVTGAIYAARKELFEPLPAGTILDDVYVPMRIALRGHRVAFEEDAIAEDVASARLEVEFRRKVRTLAGNYQLLSLLPQLWAPWRNRLWWQYVSHKVCRLIAPFALIVLFLTSAALATVATGYAVFFALQAVFYALAVTGWSAEREPPRLTSVPLTFFMLNMAAIVALVEYLRLRRGAEPHRLWVRSTRPER